MAQKNRIKKLELPILCLLFGICLLSCSQKHRLPKASPNILILLVDSLRADRLHDYGYFRNTNPFLSEFGKKGVRFTRAYSHSSQTKLSVASLFTGLIPPLHNVRHAATPSKENKNEILSDVLSNDLVTLAEVLHKEGYSTAAYITNPHLRSFLGFSQGFEEYQYFPFSKFDAEEINEQAVSWLERQTMRPYFLYIHYMDVHLPYNPPSKYKYLYTEEKEMDPIQQNGPFQSEITEEQLKYTEALYDAQINYWDDCFQSLIKRMEEKEELNNTLIIILADHGEEFYDHGGFGHGYTLYEEELLVPLYIIFEGLLPTHEIRVDPIQLIDIFPTICHFSGINTAKAPIQGINIFHSDGNKIISNKIHYAETCYGEISRSIQTDKYKLIYQSKLKDFKLFNLIEDPGEQNDLYSHSNPDANRLRGKLFELMNFEGKRAKSETKKLDTKTIEELKSLGYIK